MIKPRKNLIGQKFNLLTVIEQDEDYIGSDGVKRLRWKCKCDCGNNISVLSNALVVNRTKSCGCLHLQKLKERNQKKFKDLTGQRFGKIVVLNEVWEYNKNNKKVLKWLCQCDCGKQTIVNDQSLKRGETKSCGCLQKEITSKNRLDDLTGKKFGKLFVVDRADDYITPSGNHFVYWNCLCDCGGQICVAGSSLKNGLTTSCGCIKSNGEMKIESLLIENKIPYKKQYTFDDLRGPNNGLLRFDFGILNSDKTLKCLIEFDGVQHFKPVDFAGKGAEWSRRAFLDNRQRDQIKTSYCSSHQIPLIRINYTEINNLSLSLLFQKIS